MEPRLLRATNKPGHGWEIEALVPKSVYCFESTLKATFQPIVQSKDTAGILLGYAPWIQFTPQEWDDMIGKIFTEMVELWNEKHTVVHAKFEKGDTHTSE
jgi:hypothetical protein